MSAVQTGVALKDLLQTEAARLGFDALGVAPVDAELRREYYERWIAEGQHGGMAWLARNNDRRLAPARLISGADGSPQARSLVVAGVNYYQEEPARDYRIAKYALGRDYHNVLLKRLQKLCAVLRAHGGTQRPYVDTGPILEKALAARAGLGWQGKSTILIHPKLGTWLVLGVIVTTLELPADAPVADRCGACTACVDACPTGAITAPYQLDARRCLAYLLIEHHGAIPLEYRAAVGNRLFGCDECLDVCPWNKWARATREAAFTPRDYPDLRAMLAWTEDDFRAHTQGTPLARLKLARLKRNACVVLGNTGTAADLPALEAAARDEDPVLAEHAQWAAERLRGKLT
ncbi:MAG: tRNA epoxyqueuosine(34) reductase QueG [Opitutales bacterium]